MSPKKRPGKPRKPPTRRPPPPPETDAGRGQDEPPSVWVTSDMNPDGSPSYIVTVSATEDIALSLKADATVRYVAAVNRAAVIARHDAAVIRQLTGMGLPLESAGFTVADLRADREPVQDEATAPLRFEPIVSASSGDPYVHLWAVDKRITQWTPDDCFEHAGYVMQALAGADLDSAYLRYLVHTIHIDPARARAVVSNLGDQGTGLRDDPESRLLAAIFGDDGPSSGPDERTR